MSMTIDLDQRRVKEMQLLLFITWVLRWYHWWWFVGKWRGGLTSNRGMLYLSVVFESGLVKKSMIALSTCKKRLANCRSIGTAVSRGRHLIDGFVQTVWGKKQSMTKQRWGRGLTLCNMSECVMESAAEREAFTQRASHVLKHEWGDYKRQIAQGWSWKLWN